MIGSVERIAQEIAALDQRVATIAQELHSAYSDYLTALGPAVRQQLILASYHVCTQGYPESFLRLSYSQRHPLQKTLRHLAQQVQEELLAQLHIPVAIEEATLEEPQLDELEMLMNPAPPAPEAAAETPSVNRSLAPADLLQWQRDLEQAIVDELQTASHAANRLLQQAGILPQKLPQAILEAATKADSEVSGNAPNVLSLLLEGGSQSNSQSETPSEGDEATSVLRIVAIHLRLTEIEFADPTSTALRTRLRSLTAQLKPLARDYQKKQRERSISEAQAAWRSSWSNE